MVEGLPEPAENENEAAPNEEEEEIVYDSDDFISRPILSASCTVPDDFLNFLHSFGFESVKRYNICLADNDHVIHWSGRIMHIVNMRTMETTFRRCNDSGFGHIIKHPTLPYIVVGEKGTYPYIIVYNWPDFSIIQVMKRGTKRAYSFLDFSADGNLLASQGAAPDYTLTLWHWAKGWVLLRCKAHTQDVYRTEFSRHFPGTLISSGSGHIKFWTMADTFTGLKLQGKLGKFGKTPISDTSTFYGLNDGFILSAAENGNMLMWESAEIKLEVIRGKSEPCHTGVINYFEFDDESGDLFTLGSEGKMRCWEFSGILKGKPKGDRKLVSGLASFEMDIKDEFGTAYIQYVLKMSYDPESPLFYRYIAQDLGGSIWNFDLNLKGQMVPPRRLFLKHRGPIVGMGTSPGDYFVATFGIGGKLIVHNMITAQLVMARQFEPSGSAMLWLPGTMLVVLGFGDGTLRIVLLSIRQADKPDAKMGSKFISCIQAIKPHSSRISCISLHDNNEVLSTGSDDGTIFIYKLAPYRDYVKLIPCGITSLEGPVYSLAWQPNKDTYCLVACLTIGIVTEAQFIGVEDFKPSDKYLVPLSIKNTTFKSVKSEIIRDSAARMVAQSKENKVARKREKLEKMKEENPGLVIDETVFFQDSEEDIELPPLYYPSKAGTIFFARYIDGRYWLSPSGYDAGYFYLYYLGTNSPNECIPITDIDEEITCVASILDDKYIFLGVGNGAIRVIKTNKENWFDFSDYFELGMHDCDYGRISNIRFSHDLRYVLTCGTDSNLFNFKLNLNDDEFLPYKNLPPIMPLPDYEIDGIIAPDYPSLQDINATAKLRELEGEAAEMMQLKIKELHSIGEKMNELWALNDFLPKDKRLSVTDMELHPKFTRFLRQEFEEKLSVWEKKLQFDYEKAKILFKKVHTYYLKQHKNLDIKIKCLKSDAFVETFRMKGLSSQLVEAEKFVEKFMGRRTEVRKSVSSKTSVKQIMEKKKHIDTLPRLDPNLDKYVPLLSPQEKILYDAFQKRRNERASLIEELEKGRPDVPKDVSTENPALSAKQGRKLKTDPVFRLPFSKRITKQLKLAHVMRTYKQIALIKDEFNKKVLNLRDLKGKEMRKFRYKTELHNKILEHIPAEEALPLPAIPPSNMEMEYPELYFTAETDETENGENEPIDITNQALEVMNPQVLHYYNNSVDKSLDLQEYYAINIYPSIIRLKKLQERMIFETNIFIEDFDNRVRSLIYEKMQYNFKTTQLELYLGTLIQEISIISRYQFNEERTQSNMQSYLAIKAIYNLKIFVRKKRITRKEYQIESFNSKIKDIVTEFQNMVTGSKYVKHLTKVFKKKYRPPKKDDDDESESESSSSESESSSEKDDDEGDVGGIAAYKFDETICPDGCDPYMFSRLFKLRQSRHELEAKILEFRKDIATNLHDMVGMKRIIKIDDVLLAIYQLQLDRISREKQFELNQVSMCLILNSSQIQNWQVDRKEYIHPKNLVVASVKAIKDLKESRRQLSITTSALRNQSKQHELHKVHLRKDIAKFEQIHKQLLVEKKETLIQKFGIETNVYTLDVEVTRRLLLSKAYDVVLDERFGLLKQLKERMYIEKEKLAALKKMHANNLFTLAAIENEKYKALKNEQKLKQCHLHEYITEDQLDTDIKNLEKILAQQRLHKEKIKHEIRFLKFKDCGPVTKATRDPSSKTSGTGPSPEEVVSVDKTQVEMPSDLIEQLETKKKISSPDTLNRPDQEELNFEDIFSRVLKQVIPSEILIEDSDYDFGSITEITEEQDATSKPKPSVGESVEEGTKEVRDSQMSDVSAQPQPEDLADDGEVDVEKTEISDDKVSIIKRTTEESTKEETGEVDEMDLAKGTSISKSFALESATEETEGAQLTEAADDTE